MASPITEKGVFSTLAYGSVFPALMILLVGVTGIAALDRQLFLGLLTVVVSFLCPCSGQRAMWPNHLTRRGSIFVRSFYCAG